MVKKLENTKAYLMLSSRKSVFCGTVKKVYDYAFNVLPKINRVFSNYTGHGTLHSLNVADYMYDLCDFPDELSDLELAVILCAALLHDVGMVVTDDEIELIKKDGLKGCNRKYALVLEKYGNENSALQECIRPIHGKRAYEHIMQMDLSYFTLPEYTGISFKEELAKICAAHSENFDRLTENLPSEQVKGSYSFNAQFIAVLLRLGDCLDFDEERTPFYLYKLLAPNGVGDLEWRQHLVIENKEKIVVDEKSGIKSVAFYGKSTSADIHRKLLKYFDLINSELINAVRYSAKNAEKKYVLSVQPALQNKVETIGFNFSDFKLSLDYQAVSSLLMGENIYGSKKYGLRELLQNSIDACMVMKEEAAKLDIYKYTPYNPYIKVILDYDNGCAVIKDNGKGMSVDILKKYFLNIGVSYYTSEDYLFCGNSYAPIGNYGIGFLSCFMLSDNVKIVTKLAGESNLNVVELKKSSAYICLTCKNSDRPHGTDIVLDLKSFMAVFENNEANVKDFIEENFLDCSVPFEIMTFKGGLKKTEVLKLNTVGGTLPNYVDLSGYLNGITATVRFTDNKLTFLKNFSDLYSDNCYIYDSENNKLLYKDEEKDVLLKNYVKNGKLTYLSVPIIDYYNEDDYKALYSVYNDVEEALDAINCDTAYIITEDSSLYNTSDEIKNNDYLLGELTLNAFRKIIGYETHLPIYTTLKTKRVISGSGEKLLPYWINNGEGLFMHSFATQKIFIRNVLIKYASLEITPLIDGLMLNDITLNIMDKGIIPNISRNNISEENAKKLSYAIGKAIHLWIYENADLTREEKELLKNFINAFYAENNELLSVRHKFNLQKNRPLKTKKNS